MVTLLNWTWFNPQELHMYLSLSLTLVSKQTKFSFLLLLSFFTGLVCPCVRWHCVCSEYDAYWYIRFFVWIVMNMHYLRKYIFSIENTDEVKSC